MSYIKIDRTLTPIEQKFAARLKTLSIQIKALTEDLESHKVNTDWKVVSAGKQKLDDLSEMISVINASSLSEKYMENADTFPQQIEQKIKFLKAMQGLQAEGNIYLKGIEKEIYNIENKINTFQRLTKKAEFEVSELIKQSSSPALKSELQESLNAIRHLTDLLTNAKKTPLEFKNRSTLKQEIGNRYNIALKYFEDKVNENVINENLIKAKSPKKLDILKPIIHANTRSLLPTMSTIKSNVQEAHEGYHQELKFKKTLADLRQEEQRPKDDQKDDHLSQKINVLRKITSRAIDRLNTETSQQFKEATKLGVDAPMLAVNKIQSSLETLRVKLDVIKPPMEILKTSADAVKKVVKNVDEVISTAKPPKKLLSVLTSIRHNITNINLPFADLKHSRQESTLIKEDLKKAKNEAAEGPKDDRESEKLH